MTIDTCNNLDESYARKLCQVKKTNPKSYMLYNSTYITFLNKIIEMEDRLVVAKD